MSTTLEDLPTELFYSIFDYFWAHELFHSFAHLNRRIDEILFHSQLHISSENEDIIYSPIQVLSLTLTSSPISLDEFVNLRSLTLIGCNLGDLHEFPPYLSRLSIKNAKLSEYHIKQIFHNSHLINVQLNLQHKLSIPSSILHSSFSNIEYLTINYVSLNDIIRLLEHTSKLKYLYVSLFGIDREQIENYRCVPSLTRLTCLSMGIAFDILCSQFLSIYFPNLVNLSIFTAYVERNLFINSLEYLLMHHLCATKKLNVSAQFIINRTLTNENIESISRRFRTAFWIKRNTRVTFKYCQDDVHAIRLYLQTTSRRKQRTRPSRF